MKELLRTLTLIAPLVAATMSSAVAQSDGEMPMKGMMGGGCPMMGMMSHEMADQSMMSQGMMGMGNMAAMAEGRLAYLRSALGITPEQEQAWTGYADAVKVRISAMQDMRQGMMDAMQNGNAMARMDARIAGMEVMLEAMKAVRPATGKLYGLLSDKQKEVADQLIGMHCGAM